MISIFYLSQNIFNREVPRLYIEGILSRYMKIPTDFNKIIKIDRDDHTGCMILQRFSSGKIIILNLINLIFTWHKYVAVYYFWNIHIAGTIRSYKLYIHIIYIHHDNFFNSWFSSLHFHTEASCSISPLRCWSSLSENMYFEMDGI